MDRNVPTRIPTIQRFLVQFDSRPDSGRHL
jgi:hypothetical protein